MSRRPSDERQPPTRKVGGFVRPRMACARRARVVGSGRSSRGARAPQRWLNKPVARSSCARRQCAKETSHGRDLSSASSQHSLDLQPRRSLSVTRYLSRDDRVDGDDGMRIGIESSGSSSSIGSAPRASRGAQTSSPLTRSRRTNVQNGYEAIQKLRPTMLRPTQMLYASTRRQAVSSSCTWTTSAMATSRRSVRSPPARSRPFAISAHPKHRRGGARDIRAAPSRSRRSDRR